jgi:hypothetical protein
MVAPPEVPRNEEGRKAKGRAGQVRQLREWRGQRQYKGRGSVGSGQSGGRAKSEECGIYRKQRGQGHYKGRSPKAPPEVLEELR